MIGLILLIIILIFIAAVAISSGNNKGESQEVPKPLPVKAEAGDEGTESIKNVIEKAITFKSANNILVDAKRCEYYMEGYLRNVAVGTANIAYGESVGLLTSMIDVNFSQWANMEKDPNFYPNARFRYEKGQLMKFRVAEIVDHSDFMEVMKGLKEGDALFINIEHRWGGQGKLMVITANGDEIGTVPKHRYDDIAPLIKNSVIVVFIDYILIDINHPEIGVVVYKNHCRDETIEDIFKMKEVVAPIPQLEEPKIENKITNTTMIYNFKDEITFTAIDFETMTGERSSACAIGLVRVQNGVIIQKFYSLINPIPDDRDKDNSHVHGITREMVKDAPTFQELWPLLKRYFEGQIIVAHNTSFDLDVLSRCCNHFGIELEIAGSYDTLDILGLPLNECCRQMDVPLDSHHDALCDATACAEILLKNLGVEPKRPHETFSKAEVSKKKIDSVTLRPLSDDEVQDQSTPFFHKKVVLTGTLKAFPKRQDISAMLKRYGADIDTAISGKTNIVILGEGFGPAKMKKITELKASGKDIVIIKEPELIEIISKYGMK